VKYNITDGSPREGKNYYRLAMIDRNSKLEYSKIVSITNKINHSLSINHIELSTSANMVSVIVNSSKMQPANLSIFDIEGRHILNAPIQLQKGNNTINKIIPLLAGGLYYAKIITADEIAIRNVISRN